MALFVERVLLVDVKTVDVLNEAYHAQCNDYLKPFGPRPGSPLNAGTKPLESKRLANTGQIPPSAQFAASPC